MSGTKIIAYADDLLLLIRGKSVSEVENITNIELKRVSRWAKKQGPFQRPKVKSNVDNTSQKERKK
jgi:hypothetical protein